MMLPRTPLLVVAVAAGMAACGSPSLPPDGPVPPPAADIPLTRRSHMDETTQAVYDRIRTSPGWLLGIGEIGTG
jgi:hypothetical protein